MQRHLQLSGLEVGTNYLDHLDVRIKQVYGTHLLKLQANSCDSTGTSSFGCLEGALSLLILNWNIM